MYGDIFVEKVEGKTILFFLSVICSRNKMYVYYCEVKQEAALKKFSFLWRR